MTTRTKRTAKPRQIEALIGSDRVLLKELMKEALQEVLEAEMTEALGAGPGERTADRVGYRSGYYSRGLVTRIGKLELRVPRDREGRFSTELFARYQRSEKALVSALAEMYVQGVSTRKVKAITEELCGHTFSASTVSRINKSLDALLRRFAQRRLDEAYPYVILDARYEKVRLDGAIQSQAVFIALGINEEGRRQVLGVELSNRESQSSWTTFVKGLKTRGRNRRVAVPAGRDPRATGDRTGDRVAGAALSEAHRSKPTSGRYSLPRQHHKHLKSTNMLERLNEEIKRRTRVVRIFPNPASCLRLVRALCAEHGSLAASSAGAKSRSWRRCTGCRHTFAPSCGRCGRSRSSSRCWRARSSPCPRARPGSWRPLATASWFWWCWLQPAAASAGPERLQRHEAVARLSTRGRFVGVEGSGHWIPLEKPEAVVDAIREMVMTLREPARA